MRSFVDWDERCAARGEVRAVCNVVLASVLPTVGAHCRLINNQTQALPEPLASWLQLFPSVYELILVVNACIYDTRV